MIGYLRGILHEKEEPNIILDVAGIGYELQIPLNSFALLPAIGKELNLYVHSVSREDGQFLYGFLAKSQKSLFRSLIKVNGIGPKIAMTILSVIEPDVFVRFVLQNDSESLERVPGIGAKTAKRLVIELRDALAEWESVGIVTDSKISTASRDAISALIALGYKPHEAQKAVEKHQDKKLESEALIKLALKEIK